MADANGGEGYLKGLINRVPLTCGAVKTVCDMFVGDTVPFDSVLFCAPRLPIGSAWISS